MSKRQCPQCDGCGKIASGDEGAPWTFWENLPLRNAVAVVAGLVKPLPCPRCRGRGTLGLHCDSCTCHPTAEPGGER